METSSLMAICITAFVSVFVLLTVLAGVMRLITSIFPQVAKAFSEEHAAAITTTIQTLIPGSKVTRIEEIK